jgi:hypothetical protein
MKNIKNILLICLLAITSATWSQGNYLKKILVVPDASSPFQTVINDLGVVLDAQTSTYYLLPTGSNNRNNTLDSITNKTTIAGNVTDTITLDSSNILHLNSTPVQLVASPGAGYINIIERVIVDYSYSTAEYTGDSTLAVYYTGLGNYAESIAAIDDTLSKTSVFVQTALSPVGANKAILLKSKTSDPVGATALGTIRVYVTYKRIKLY